MVQSLLVCFKIHQLSSGRHSHSCCKGQTKVRFAAPFKKLYEKQHAETNRFWKDGNQPEEIFSEIFENQRDSGGNRLHSF